MFSCQSCVDQFSEVWAAGDLSIKDGISITNCSPYSVYLLWCKETRATNMSDSLLQISPQLRLFAEMYRIIFDVTHKQGSTIKRLQQCYATRWCCPSILNRTNATNISILASKQLIWLSLQRIHCKCTFTLQRIPYITQIPGDRFNVFVLRFGRHRRQHRTYPALYRFAKHATVEYQTWLAAISHARHIFSVGRL